MFSLDVDVIIIILLIYISLHDKAKSRNTIIINYNSTKLTRQKSITKNCCSTKVLQDDFFSGLINI
jgi:hypothetical protein